MCRLNPPKTKKLIGLVFLFSFFWNIPNCFLYKYQTRDNITSVVETDLAKDESGSYDKFYSTYGYAIIRFFLPMVILIVLNSLIVKQVSYYIVVLLHIPHCYSRIF